MIFENNLSNVKTIIVQSQNKLIYTFYKSEISWGGSRSSYYLTYYFISFSLIIFSIFSFFLNHKIKEYLITCEPEEADSLNNAIKFLNTKVAETKKMGVLLGLKELR